MRFEVSGISFEVPDFKFLVLSFMFHISGFRVWGLICNVAHIRQSRPDSGLDFQGNSLKRFELSTLLAYITIHSSRAWVQSLSFRV